MPSTRDQAVCIRHWDWSETSQTVSLFCREQGVVRGIAKGSRRDKAPFSGGIELLTRGEVVQISRPTSELTNITAWDLQETFPAIGSALDAFHGAMYLADVVRHSLHDRDPHPELFDGLVDALRRFASEPARAVVFGFLWQTLNECGWKPELERDVVTGLSLTEEREYAFAPALGGFTVQSAGGVAPAGPVWRVRAQTVALLRRLGLGGFDPRDAAVDRGMRLLHAYLTTVLGRDLPAAAAMLGEP